MRTRFAATGGAARGLLSDRKVISEQPQSAAQTVIRGSGPALPQVVGSAVEQVEHFGARYLARVVRHSNTSESATSAAPVSRSIIPPP